MTVPYAPYADHLQGAKLIGDTFTKVGLQYNADDNTWTEYEYEQKALACEVNLKTRFACNLWEKDIFAAMFGN